MPLDLVTIPCRTDNYAYLLHDAATGRTALIDAPDEAPIRAALDARGWRLTDLLITHHHDDHISAVQALRGDARVVGAGADAHRLPPLDLRVAGGETLTVCGAQVAVIDVPGHTLGHIAFHVPAANAAFTADSLMSWGCGRLFEGTPAQMWDTLQRLSALPEDTLICSGHEYTAGNGRFALTIEPDNPAYQARMAEVTAARAAGRPTVPVTLATELASNPFMRAGLPTVKAAVGMAGTPDVEVFAEIRRRKDRF